VKLAIDTDLLDPPPVATLLHHLGMADERIEEVTVDELDRLEGIDHLTSVYLPELRTVGPAAEDLVDLMARLRAECPWDQRQTHASLTRHLLEEAYEALEALEALAHALEAGDELDEVYAHAAEELGDLVFQVVFHAHLAAEDGRFDLTQVLDGVRTKLISRHPHVFADVVAETPDEVAANWEDLKRAEKGRTSVTEGIPAALPALARYVKLRRKATAIGLTEPTLPEARAEVLGALEALDALEPTPRGDAEGSSAGPEADAVGALLAAVAEVARLRGVDAEMALRQTSEHLRDEIVALEDCGSA
jgi:tetrapyrrole methylase family protein/MazG family protein